MAWGARRVLLWTDPEDPVDAAVEIVGTRL
jgi:hypothetical protein